MVKNNGKAGELDLEHELPEGEANEGGQEQPPGSADSAPTAPPATELEQLRGERDQLLDRLARTQAEFDNFRKRSAREQADFRDYAVAEALKSMLPVLDNLSLALNARGSEQDLRSGVELIRRQLEDVLGKLGVQPISAAMGDAFDPHFHMAVEVVESDEVPGNHIVQELQRGYRVKDRLLRPAMVRVARG